MSEHFNTGEGWPQTREEVEAEYTRALEQFMGMCDVEPANFDDCLACYAYEIVCKREETERVLAQGLPRRDFNAECPDRPGVTVGEDLADKNLALGFSLLALEIKAKALLTQLSIDNDIRGDAEELATTIIDTVKRFK